MSSRPQISVTASRRPAAQKVGAGGANECRRRACFHARAPPRVAALDRIQPDHRRDPRGGRLLHRLVHRPSGQRRQLRIPVRHRRERRRSDARLSRRRDRLPDRSRLRQLSRLAHVRPARLIAREGARGHESLLRPLHRPQGGRPPVPRRHRDLLLHRRRRRDADSHRAAARPPRRSDPTSTSPWSACTAR